MPGQRIFWHHLGRFLAISMLHTCTPEYRKLGAVVRTSGSHGTKYMALGMSATKVALTNRRTAGHNGGTLLLVLGGNGAREPIVGEDSEPHACRVSRERPTGNIICTKRVKFRMVVFSRPNSSSSFVVDVTGCVKYNITCINTERRGLLCNFFEITGRLRTTTGNG